MTHHPDKAREAARIAARFFVGAKAADVAIDAFLAASVPADVGELIRACRNFCGIGAPSDHATMERAADTVALLAAQLTALSAKLKEQKAAHAKMLRDEGMEYRDKDTALGYEIDMTLRRLADRIEGGE